MDSSPKIKLHKAKKISDYYGTIYTNEVLDEIDVGDIVRISLVVEDHYLDDTWTHDSPYVLIIKKEMLSIDNDNDDDNEIFIGEIHSDKRQLTDKYPISLGERVMFSKDNIIEIPENLQSSNEKSRFSKYLTEEKITITGPLYTIQYEYSSEDETDSNPDSELEDGDLTSGSEEYVSDSD